MGLKKAVRAYLTANAKRKHENDVRSMTFHYDLHIGELENEKPQTLSNHKIITVFYDDIITRESGSKVSHNKAIDRASEDDIIIFCRREGRLFKYAKEYIGNAFEEHKDINLLYTDEDELDENGMPYNPYFKPDWSPDSYLNAFYIGSIYAARAGLVKKAIVNIIDPLIMPWDKANASYLDYSDMAVCDKLFGHMALIEGGFDQRDGMKFPIYHLDKVLFHRAYREDLFLGREFHKENHNIESPVKVSIVIPSKDHPEVLRQCLESLNRYGSGSKNVSYEIIVVDNGSCEDKKKQYEDLLEKMRAYISVPSKESIDSAAQKQGAGLTDISYIYEPRDFNFSYMCNLGASKASGDLILFLNDDIEIVSGEWLRELSYYAMLPHVGAVGCKLLYPADPSLNPDGSLIQHAGLTAIHIGPMHKLQRLSDSKAWYFGANRGTHDMCGVTAACLMVGRDKFEALGGYYEGLAVAFNDVDLNWRLLEEGYYNVCCNYFNLVHHESLSRGDDNADAKKTDRLMRENDTLMKRHMNMYTKDPFYHQALVNDDVAQDYIMANPKIPHPDEIESSNAQLVPKGYPDSWKNECVWFRTDYIGSLNKWNKMYYKGRKEKPVNDTGYFIKGYSFVVGSDNAIYNRTLLLRRVKSSDDLTPLEHCVYSFKVHDMLREDVEKNLKDQQSVEITGYRSRIEDGVLPKGTYQAGMLYKDTTSRTRVLNWGTKTMDVI